MNTKRTRRAKRLLSLVKPVKHRVRLTDEELAQVIQLVGKRLFEYHMEHFYKDINIS